MSDEVKITILPPGRAEGCDDLRQWGSRRLVGNAGVWDKKDKKGKNRAVASATARFVRAVKGEPTLDLSLPRYRRKREFVAPAKDAASLDAVQDAEDIRCWTDGTTPGAVAHLPPGSSSGRPWLTRCRLS